MLHTILDRKNNIYICSLYSMGTRYSDAELEKYTEDYQDIKSGAEEIFEEEVDTPDEAHEEKLWEFVQSQYHKKVEYDRLEDYAKLAEAAYVQVEHKVDHTDWRDVQDRIVNYTLWRDHPVGHREEHDMTAYLPSSYTISATEEIVIHSIVLDLTTDE